MKKCFKCGLEKEESGFRIRRNECRECRQSYGREYREPNYKGVPCGRKSKTQTLPDGSLVRGCNKCNLTLPLSEFYPRNKRGGHMSACMLCNNIWSYLNQAAKLKYGLSVEKWNDRVLRQGGACAICGEKAKLCVDHDHASKAVRGLLCSWCNRGLGFFRDSSTITQQAADYLKQHGK